MKYRHLLLVTPLLLAAAPDSGYRGTQTQVVFATQYQQGSDTCGIQEAIDSCGDYVDGGCVVQLPRGECVTTETITVGTLGSAAKAGIILQGHGDGFKLSDISTSGTSIRYNGDDEGTVLELNGLRQSTIQNLTIDCDYEGDGTNQAAIGIDLRGENTGGTIVTRNTFRDLTIEDCSDGSAGGIAMRIAGNPIGGDDQVDQSVLTRVLFKDSDTCLVVDSGNADATNLFGVHCQQYAAHGLDFVDGDFYVAGGIITTDAADNATSCAIRIGDQVHEATITGEDIEVDDGDGICTDGTTRVRVTTITGNSIGIGGSNSVGVDADGQDCIDFRHGGSLHFVGNECVRRGQSATDGDPVDVFIDNGAGGTLRLSEFSNYYPSYVVRKVDRAAAADIEPTVGSRSDVWGPVWWGNRSNTSADTGDEVCALKNLTCVAVMALPNDSAVATEDNVDDHDCSTQVTIANATGDGYFLALCR